MGKWALLAATAGMTGNHAGDALTMMSAGLAAQPGNSLVPREAAHPVPAPRHASVRPRKAAATALRPPQLTFHRGAIDEGADLTDPGILELIEDVLREGDPRSGRLETEKLTFRRAVEP